MTNSLDIGQIYSVLDENGNATVNYYIQDGEYRSVEEYKLIDGQMVNIFPEIFTDTENGRQELEEHLFGENSIWF